MNKAEKEKQKLIQEKSQQILSELLKDEDNKYCVDCDAKGPRWASWNLGVFLCIRCAGIHRNLGVHISRVKSVNLDSWSPEQVAHMQRMGNSKARAVYEANLPDEFKRPQSDSPLEAFVRDKYEKKKYIAKEWVQPPTPPPAFDIEEERKKEKEKKKSKVNSKQGTTLMETNPVPRPFSSPANTAINVEKVLSVKKPSTDLLGLSAPATKSNTTLPTAGSVVASTLSSPSDDDQFDAFVSCAFPETQNEKQDEKDFFSQKALEEKKLDKESILKLYANSAAPSQSLFAMGNGANTTISPLSSNPLMPTNGLGNGLVGNGSGAMPPSSLLSNAFATNANGAFANFSQPIPPATNFFAPQPQQPLAQQNFFQSSTNPFLSPAKSADSLNIGAVNQLQSQLAAFDMGGSGLNWPTTTAPAVPTMTNNTSSVSSSNGGLMNLTSSLPLATNNTTHNPFMQSTNIGSSSLGNGLDTLLGNGFTSNVPAPTGLSTTPLVPTVNSLNGFTKNTSTPPTLDNNNANWSTLGNSTNNSTLTAGNLWE